MFHFPEADLNSPGKDGLIANKLDPFIRMAGDMGFNVVFNLSGSHSSRHTKIAYSPILRLKRPKVATLFCGLNS